MVVDLSERQMRAVASVRGNAAAKPADVQHALRLDTAVAATHGARQPGYGGGAGQSGYASNAGLCCVRMKTRMNGWMELF